MANNGPISVNYCTIQIEYYYWYNGECIMYFNLYVRLKYQEQYIIARMWYRAFWWNTILNICIYSLNNCCSTEGMFSTSYFQQYLI